MELCRISDSKGRKCVKTGEKCLSHGGIVVFPTETSYGLGGSFKSLKAAQKVFYIKKRVPEKSLPLIVSSVKAIEKYAFLSGEDRKLVKAFMPGPLSLVVKGKGKIAKEFGKGELCFRISAHPVAHGLAKALGEPVISTSANISGKEAVYSGEKAVKEFGKTVDLVIDAGKLKKRKASTIYSTSLGKVLRKGPISGKEIKEVLGERK